MQTCFECRRGAIFSRKKNKGNNGLRQLQCCIIHLQICDAHRAHKSIRFNRFNFVFTKKVHQRLPYRQLCDPTHKSHWSWLIYCVSMQHCAFFLSLILDIFSFSPQMVFWMAYCVNKTVIWLEIIIKIQQKLECKSTFCSMLAQFFFFF